MILPRQERIVTADLYDLHHAIVDVVDLPLRAFGGIGSFSGPCQTLRVHRDHTPVLAQLEQPGDGRVLVVDAGVEERPQDQTFSRMSSKSGA